MTESQPPVYVELPEPVQLPAPGLTLRRKAQELESRAARFQQEAAEHRSTAGLLESNAATMLEGAKWYRASARALEGDQ